MARETSDDGNRRTLVIASPVGRGNPVGDVMWDAGTMRGLPYAVAGLPRRPFRPPRNDNGGNLRRVGFACLAWPFWANAPLVQARPAPPSSSTMSVILPYIAPLLLLLETDTEAKADAAAARGAAVAHSRTQVRA